LKRRNIVIPAHIFLVLSINSSLYALLPVAGANKIMTYRSNIQSADVIGH